MPKALTPTQACHFRAPMGFALRGEPCVHVAGCGADPAMFPETAMVIKPRSRPGKEGETAAMRFSLTVFGCRVTVQCEDADTRTLLVANYGPLQSPLRPGDVSYLVCRPRDQNGAPLFCL